MKISITRNRKPKIKSYFDSEGFVYVNKRDVKKMLRSIGIDIRNISSQQDIKDFYDKLTPYYHIYMGPDRKYEEKVLNTISKAIEEKNSCIVIDAGCGIGLGICFLAKEFPDKKFIGYDISEGVIGEAKKRSNRHHLNNLELAVMSHDDLPNDTIKPESSDCIYAKDSIYMESLFTEDYNLFLERSRKFRNILRHNGLYIVNWEDGISLGGIPPEKRIENFGFRESKKYSTAVENVRLAFFEKI